MRSVLAVLAAVVLVACSPDGESPAATLGGACLDDGDCTNIYRCMDTERRGRICTLPCADNADCTPEGVEEICPFIRCRGICVAEPCPG